MKITFIIDCKEICLQNGCSSLQLKSYSEIPVFELMDVAAIVLAELVRGSNLEEGTVDF